MSDKIHEFLRKWEAEGAGQKSLNQAAYVLRGAFLPHFILVVENDCYMIYNLRGEGVPVELDNIPWYVGDSGRITITLIDATSKCIYLEPLVKLLNKTRWKGPQPRIYCEDASGYPASFASDRVVIEEVAA